MAKYITELQVSLSEAEEAELLKDGFIKIDVNLNKDPEGKKIYLWFKEGSSSPITRIQFSFNDEMSQGLKSAGFTKVDKNISVAADGDPIYLWYLSGKTQFSISILKVGPSTVDDPQIYKFGWERMSCDLNQSTRENQIYLWLKREKKVYLCDITATSSYEKDKQYFKDGYIRMDESTNSGAGGVPVFVWYRVSTDPKDALTDLQLSTNPEEYTHFRSQGYTQDKQDLNQGTGGNEVFLRWKKVSGDPPIREINVMFHLFLLSHNRNVPKDSHLKPANMKPVAKVVHVTDKNLNSGPGCGCRPATPVFLFFYK